MECKNKINFHWILNGTWRENKCMNQQNKKMTKRDDSTENIKRNNPLKMWRKIRPKIPDFSGKYHGKLNNKISRKSDVKISIKCNCRKKAITEKSSEF